MTELSNCCKRQVIVNSSDEGTSCYVCIKCKKACDLFKTNLDHFKLKVLIPNHSAINFDEWLDINNKELINKSEYERLKRLDKNRKKQIEYYRYKEPASAQDFNLSRWIAELLENLDK